MSIEQAELLPPWQGISFPTQQLDQLLGWEVVRKPIFIEREGRSIPLRDNSALVRTDNGTVLGVVGKQYKIFQNKELIDFTDSITRDVGGACYHSSGIFKGGRVVWIQLEMRDPLEVGNGNEIDLLGKYILCVNWHGGGRKLRVMFTTLRIACWNTLMLALRTGTDVGIAVRHYQGMQNRLAEAHRILARAEERFIEFKETARALVKMPMDVKSAGEVFAELFPEPKDKRDTRVIHIRERLVELFLHGRGNNVPPAKGTAWAVLNAVTQWTSHERKSRSGAEGRLASTWFGGSRDLANKTIALLTAKAA